MELGLMIFIESMYLFLVVSPSLYVFFKIKKLYLFSRYNGLRYLYSAFLFLSIGFFLRFIIMLIKLLSSDIGTITSFDILTAVMEFFLVLPGLLLLYSLFWKRFESNHYSKNMTLQYIFIFFIAAMISLLDMFFENFYFMYGSQIILFFQQQLSVL